MLYSDEVIYRPNEEADSLFLEFCYGCSYARCGFCHYSCEHVPLMLLDDAALEQRLLSLASLYPDKRRLFLLGGNPLAFQTGYLYSLFERIRSVLQNVNQIAMYARADDILKKQEADLVRFRQMGLATLYMGLESGDDEVLALCNKGLTVSQMSQALAKLDRIGISYSLSSILGLGGKMLSRQHAVQTGKFYSSCSPVTITVRTLQLIEGTSMAEAAGRGEFQELSLDEVLEEEITMLQNMHMKSPCLYTGNHILDETSAVAWLPKGREKLIGFLKERRAEGRV